MPLLAYVGLLAVSFKSAPKSTHGDSKFAERSELATAGLLNTSPQGVIIGRMGSQYLRDSSGKFIILAAPTR